MNLNLQRQLACAALAVLVGSGAVAETYTLPLEAAKDNFARSNNRNRNNGGSAHLLVAHNPSIKSLVGFDLSTVTNEIVAAEFTICIQNTMPTPLHLTIAPMVQTKGNASWNEGVGALGARGQNARLGESTFQWRAFRDQPWELKSGKAARNMMDEQLWEAPVARLASVKWTENTWIRVKLDDAADLEEIRRSEDPVATYGLWGTAGNGSYFLYARNSGFPPKLLLELKKTEENPQ